MVEGKSMNATRQFNNINIENKIAITTKELQSALSCGRYSAVQLGEAAGAKVQFGKRVFWNVEKVKAYINEIST